MTEYDGMPVYTAAEALEYQRQKLVWGGVLLDPAGRPVPREEPEYWRYLRVSGRGYGKSSYARKMAEIQERIQRIIDKTEELHRLAATWPTTTVTVIPEIDEFRWACHPPTDMPAPGTPAWYTRQAVQFLGGKRWL